MTDLRTAAQQALAAMEAAEVDPHSSEAVYRAIEAIRAALEAPVQDPVASLMTNIQSGDMEVVWNDDGFDRELWHETPLYTAPPQRKPLTEDVATELVRSVVSSSPRPIGMVEYGMLVARAIERAHGIKP